MVVPAAWGMHGVSVRCTSPTGAKAEMTSDTGDYEITGSVTGPDGKGNAFKPFTSGKSPGNRSTSALSFSS